MKAFLWTAEDWWGTCLARGQLDEVCLIDKPGPQPYLDNKQTDQMFPALEEEVTPEMGDKYIQASIMQSCGSTFATGTVVSHKHDAEGNFIGHAHVDIYLYDVDLPMVRSPL